LKAAISMVKSSILAPAGNAPAFCFAALSDAEAITLRLEML